MEIREERTREVKENVLMETECDWCKKTIKIERGDAYECTIELRTGWLWPEGGDGEHRRIDLCKECAENLFEHLEGYGIRVNKSEWDC